MPCKKADRFQEKLAKFECDECGASLFRWMQSAATGRSRQEHCKYRHRRNGGGGSSQSPRRVGPEGGEGGLSARSIPHRTPSLCLESFFTEIDFDKKLTRCVRSQEFGRGGRQDGHYRPPSLTEERFRAAVEPVPLIVHFLKENPSAFTFEDAPPNAEDLLALL
ncbi:hypothetical protein HETIRDRAFT_101003 [Heterobasidion irregulare TC 32-1]|uniref:Uncharacterized protein n=1 Tax=Heterobasidion irregulare (strain TC 32-1) TaxID=747525 RepID=W4KJ30_HETIT|nr:uncharacterized protein HETIRDRAFT_101003 [Heterobasidion irregulare TC 32-1]ETW85310.1 hypothetical protein HETIRDRAFT_101003 [Heterobasidion irregulare TC 32-1]